MLMEINDIYLINMGIWQYIKNSKYFKILIVKFFLRVWKIAFPLIIKIENFEISYVIVLKNKC